MNSPQHKSLWPQFLLLVGLFVLCLFVPSAWQSTRPPEPKRSSSQPGDVPAKSQELQPATVSKPHASTREEWTVNENPLVLNTPVEPIATTQDVRPSVNATATIDSLEKRPLPPPPIAKRRVLEPQTTLDFIGETAAIALAQNKETVLSNHARLTSTNSPYPAKPKSQYPSMVEMISYQVANANNSWPNPVSLLEQLEGIAVYQPAQPWVIKVQGQLEQLRTYPTLKDPQAKQTLHELTTLVKSGNALAETTPDLEFQSNWLRAIYALDRRLTIWHAIYRITTNTTETADQVEQDRSKLRHQILTVQKEMAGLPNGKSWINYLLLENLLKTVRSTEEADSLALNALACQVLNRLDSPLLSESQRRFLTSESIQNLRPQLQEVVTSHLEPVRLLHELEKYESQATTQQANVLASQYQYLRWSLNDNKRNLATHMDTHYRNANIRIAVAQKMINRLLPSPKSLEEQVDDTILGAQVSGKSRTSTILKVFLIPDKKQWRMGVEASGEVDSDTETRRRTVTFHNKGSSRYTVNKDLQVDRRGIRVGRAIAKTDIHSELLGFETNFDSLPLVGAIIRSFVRHQYDLQSNQAESIYENRVSHRAQNRFDQEIKKHLLNVEERFQSRYLKPLQNLNLSPVAVDLQTTTGSRLILRYRLAGNQQMAAHTPRPRAPSDSLLSIQIHESAINNTLQNLKLDGKQTDLRTLYRELAEAFDRPDITVPEEIPANVTVSMADQEAVQVQFEEGKVNLRIHLKELKSGRRHKWKNFILTASYRPSMDQLTASLYRDGHLQFEGKQLRLGDRIALQGIFNKALPRHRPVNIINKNMADHDGMQNLTVTQFVIRDTWIGVAIGPTEVPEARVANQRKNRSSSRNLRE